MSERNNGYLVLHKPIAKLTRFLHPADGSDHTEAGLGIFGFQLFERDIGTILPQYVDRLGHEIVKREEVAITPAVVRQFFVPSLLVFH